jgi:hypothetical protein
MTERMLSLAASKNLAQNIGFLGWARVFGVVLGAAVVLMLYALIHILPEPIGDGHMDVHPALPLSTYLYITLGFVLTPALTVVLAQQWRRYLPSHERIAAQSLLVAFTVGCFFYSTLFDSATGHFFCIGHLVCGLSICGVC